MKNDAKPTKMPNLRGARAIVSSTVAMRRCSAVDSPDQDIPLLLDHHEVDAAILMLTHEGMWNKMKKDV